jgi:hypothetical protein
MEINNPNPPIGSINSGSVPESNYEAGKLSEMQSIPTPEASPAKIGADQFRENANEQYERLRESPDTKSKELVGQLHSMKENIMPATLAILTHSGHLNPSSLDIVAKAANNMFTSYLMSKMGS